MTSGCSPRSQFDDDAQAFAVAFVAQIRDAFDLFLVNQLGDALDEASPC